MHTFAGLKKLVDSRSVQFEGFTSTSGHIELDGLRQVLDGTHSKNKIKHTGRIRQNADEQDSSSAEKATNEKK